jgi:hypothetical protein
MRILTPLVAVSLALASVAIGGAESRAQAGPESHPYCALDSNGGTDCYYDSRQACGARCIENPWFAADGAALAQARDRAPRRSRR